MVKKIMQSVGMLFIISGFIFLFIYNFIVTGSKGENFSRDLFGFPIPHPPLWTSYIPIIGFFLGFIFEFLSIHGVIGIIILVTLFSIGSCFLNLADKTK